MLTRLAPILHLLQINKAHLVARKVTTRKGKCISDSSGCLFPYLQAHCLLFLSLQQHTLPLHHTICRVHCAPLAICAFVASVRIVPGVFITQAVSVIIF